MKNLYFILIMFLMIVGCSNASRESSSSDLGEHYLMEENTPITEQSQIAPAPPTPPIKNAQKIIKNGRMGLEVENLSATKSKIDGLVKQYEGFYAQERLNNTDWQTGYELRIRVPAHQFERLVKAMETGMGKIKYKQIEAQDVTEQFVDLETRLANKRSYIKKYNDLLSRAASVKDILEIESQMRVIEEEIESSMGRLKYLQDQVSMSSLELEVSTPPKINYDQEQRDKFGNRLKNALANGWYALGDLVILFIKLWPFWILIALIVFLFKKLNRRKNSKNNPT